MQFNQYIVRTVFSISLLVSLSAFAEEASIVEQVIGRHPLSSATTEIITTVSIVKDSTLSFAKDCWSGAGNAFHWGKDLCQDNLPKISRVGYQLGKAFVAYSLGMKQLPISISFNSNHQPRFGKAQPVAENAHRVGSAALFVHALRGLIREAGFEDVKDLFRSAEGLNNSDLN